TAVIKYSGIKSSLIGNINKSSLCRDRHYGLSQISLEFRYPVGLLILLDKQNVDSIYSMKQKLTQLQYEISTITICTLSRISSSDSRSTVGMVSSEESSGHRACFKH